MTCLLISKKSLKTSLKRQSNNMSEREKRKNNRYFNGAYKKSLESRTKTGTDAQNGGYLQMKGIHRRSIRFNLEQRAASFSLNTVNLAYPDLIVEFLEKNAKTEGELKIFLEQIKKIIFNFLDINQLAQVNLELSDQGKISVRAPWELLSHFKEFFVVQIKNGFVVYANEFPGHISHHKYLNSIMYEKYYRHFPKIEDLNNGVRCLEIGSGHKPSPLLGHRNTVAGERFIDESTIDRPIGQTAIRVNNLVQLDGTSTLPFLDETFDFCVISHVLEHLEPFELVKMLYEALRVSRRVYLEVPNFRYEKNFGYEGHTSIISRDRKGKLIIEYKTERELYNQLFANDKFLKAKKEGLKNQREMAVYYGLVHPNVDIFYEGVILNRSDFLETDQDDFSSMNIEEFIIKLEKFIKILIPSDDAIVTRKKAVEIKDKIESANSSLGKGITDLNTHSLLNIFLMGDVSPDISLRKAKQVGLAFKPAGSSLDSELGTRAKLDIMIYISILEFINKSDKQ